MTLCVDSYTESFRIIHIGRCHYYILVRIQGGYIDYAIIRPIGSANHKPWVQIIERAPTKSG